MKTEELKKRRHKDLTGSRFGMLSIVERLVESDVFYKGHNRRFAYLCECDCGNTKILFAERLTAGKDRNCGCVRNPRPKKHGMYKTKIYYVWSQMKRRCEKSKSGGYKWYGARGITVSEDWKDFARFYQDMGKDYREGLSLDRIDNDSGYSKENCRWATAFEQAQNKRNRREVTIDGTTMILEDWARFFNTDNHTISKRLAKGFSGWRLSTNNYDWLRMKNLWKGQRIKLFKEVTGATNLEIKKVFKVSMPTLVRSLQPSLQIP